MRGKDIVVGRQIIVVQLGKGMVEAQKERKYLEGGKGGKGERGNSIIQTSAIALEELSSFSHRQGSHFA